MPKPSWHAVDLVSLKPNRKTAHKTAQINSDGRASCMTAQPRRWPPHHTHINIKTTKHIKITISGTTVTIGTVTLVTLVLHTRHHPWWVLVHLVHFVTCDVWYTGWYTTPVSTPSSFLAHFWHTRMIFGHFRYVCRAGVTFFTPVTFGTVTLVTLFLHTTHHPWWVLVHLVHFITCDVWYTGWYTTPSTPNSFLARFGTLEWFLVIFSTFGAGVTFATAVTFDTITLVTLFLHTRYHNW